MERGDQAWGSEQTNRRKEDSVKITLQRVIFQGQGERKNNTKTGSFKGQRSTKKKLN